MSIEIKEAYSEQNEIAKLFQEYTDMLIKNDSTFLEYLAIQNYEQELLHLESKYGLPDGRLYIAYYDKKVAGCIGLRKLDADSCEMKRLYVRDEFRGKHIGSKLINKVIDEARKIGYRTMYLDTLPFLKSALYMYKQAGFYETDCYNNSPMESSIYMKLDL